MTSIVLFLLFLWHINVQLHRAYALRSGHRPFDEQTWYVVLGESYVSLSRPVPRPVLEMLCTLLFTTFEHTGGGLRCTGCSYIRRVMEVARPPNLRQCRGSCPTR